MVKKQVVLSPEDISYVQNLAKISGDPRAVKGNFSRALREIIMQHKAFKEQTHG